MSAAGAGLDRFILAALPRAETALLIYAADRRLASQTDMPTNPITNKVSGEGSGTAARVG
jgi:hypothetical protein